MFATTMKANTLLPAILPLILGNYIYFAMILLNSFPGRRQVAISSYFAVNYNIWNRSLRDKIINGRVA